MPSTIIEKTKKQKYLIGVFGILIIAIAIVIYRGYFAEETVPIEQTAFIPQKRMDINVEILKSPMLSQLQPFEKIQPLGTTTAIGRENPFVPY